MNQYDWVAVGHEKLNDQAQVTVDYLTPEQQNQKECMEPKSFTLFLNRHQQTGHNLLPARSTRKLRRNSLSTANNAVGRSTSLSVGRTQEVKKVHGATFIALSFLNPIDVMDFLSNNTNK